MQQSVLAADGREIEVSPCLINTLYDIFLNGLPFAAPDSTLKTNELDLVQGVLEILQGFSSSFFYWDDNEQIFHVKHGLYVSHLSQTSLCSILSQFKYAAACLKLVEIFVKKVEISSVKSPTVKAFTNSVSLWLKRLRDVALREQVKLVEFDDQNAYTLLGLANALSSLCSAAELLWQIVQGAIPEAFLDSLAAASSGELAVHLLDYLYSKLDEVCLVHGGEEAAYHMLLVLFIGSLLPYIEGIDSWLYDGTLDDPYNELFFYANDAITIDQPSFWEKSYLLRRSGPQKLGLALPPVTAEVESIKNEKRDLDGREPSVPLQRNDIDIVCPLFIKGIAKSILSAGKSLKLTQHVLGEAAVVLEKNNDFENCVINDKYFDSGTNSHIKHMDTMGTSYKHLFECYSAPLGQRMHHGQSKGCLTLSEVFCVSLVGLAGDKTHISKYFKHDLEIVDICATYIKMQKAVKENCLTNSSSITLEKNWCNFLVDTMAHKRHKIMSGKGTADLSHLKGLYCFDEKNEVHKAADIDYRNCNTDSIDDMGEEVAIHLSCPGNPAISVCRGEVLDKENCNKLSLSHSFCLPSLNDEDLRVAIFGENHNYYEEEANMTKFMTPRSKGTNYAFGFLFRESEHLRLKDDLRTMEALFPFPTLLPSFKDVPISKVLPSQKNSTLTSSVLSWLESSEPKSTILPSVIVHECLIVYIKKQVDYVGRHILWKLMNGWRLMDELVVLRAIYLLGSGDLLQQFLTVLFNKLDKGDSWDDDFELNTILQESIRNSSDGMLLTSVDSLVVTITKAHASDEERATSSSIPHRYRAHSFGIDALDMLKFTYKVSWPLELIANREAIMKYNQVMGFLLKVKRAKFALDKARRWMWKARGISTINQKHHLVVEQKLLHFVDAFHQYVMDKVFHSAWLDLCRGMSTAGSLDEVIEVHEVYLLSIQRQCFVAPDKLWALIACRVKSILGLALDFYSIQQTLCSGGAAPAIKARCEMEVDRVEKHFDDCIAVLLRVLSFKLNVGHFPHLADLVTRLNYNYFYMPDSGIC